MNIFTIIWAGVGGLMFFQAFKTYKERGVNKKALGLGIFCLGFAVLNFIIK